jgi:hypothetical protein
MRDITSQNLNRIIGLKEVLGIIFIIKKVTQNHFFFSLKFIFILLAPWVPELSSEIDTKNFDELEDNSSDYIFPKEYVFLFCLIFFLHFELKF